MASIIKPEDFVSLLFHCKMSLHITDKKKWLPLSNLPSPDNFSSTLLLFIFTSSFLLSVCLLRSLLFPPLTDSIWVQFLLLRLKRGISQHGATQPGNFPNQGEQSATTFFSSLLSLKMKVERVRKPECNRNTVSGRDRHIISAALCCSCISDKQNCFAADLCSVSVPLIEKSYSLTTRHSIKVMGKTRWHEHSKQKDTQKRKEKEEGTDREEENHKHCHRQQNKPHWGPCAISNPAVCVNSWCITSLLRLEVIVLYVSFLDLAQNTQIKLRHQLKRSAGREKMNWKQK